MGRSIEDVVSQAGSWLQFQMMGSMYDNERCPWNFLHVIEDVVSQDGSWLQFQMTGSMYDNALCPLNFLHVIEDVVSQESWLQFPR